MLSGITLAVSASRESKPRICSMAAVSASRGPICRAMNSFWVVRSVILLSQASALAFSRRS